MRRFVLLAVAGLLMAANEPPLPMFAGIQLGAPPAMPECQRYVSPPGIKSLLGDHVSYLSEQPVQCIELPDGRPNEGLIYFPTATAPTIAGFNWFGYVMIDGKIEGLGVSTLDHNFSGTIIASLTAKFGKPVSDKADRTIIQNIAVPSRTVTWVGQGYSVEYRSVESMENGSLEIDTAKSLDWKVSRATAAQAKATPL